MFTPGYPISAVPTRTEQGKIFLEAASLTAKYPLGTRLQDQNGREYIYAATKTNTSIAAGDVCALAAEATQDGAVPVTTALATTEGTGYVSGSPLGIAMVAVTAVAATKQYCWFCIYAPASAPGSARVLGSSDDYAGLYTSGTAGALDSATMTGGIKVIGIQLTTAQGTAAGVNDNAVIFYPRLDAVF